MNKNILATAIALLCQVACLHSQIIIGSDTLLGNEWIRFDQPYFKIPVAEDGIYRIGYQALAAAGLPLADLPGNSFQLFHNGQEEPLYLSTDGLLGPGDYLEFFGRRNTSELDRHLFKDPEAEMMNPLYSLVTDTAAYFLTWGEGPNLRYFEQANDLSNLPPKEPYHLAKKVFNYFSAHSKRVNIAGIAASEYGVSEGYSNSFANSQTLTLSVPNPFPGGPDGTIYIRYGTNGGNHQQVISLNGQALLTEEFSDYMVREITLPVANALLTAPLSLGFQGLAAASDRQRVANVIITYPAFFKADNQSTFQFELPAADHLRYLEIEHFDVSGGLPVLYNLSRAVIQTANVENGLVRLSIPPGTSPESLLLVNKQTGVKEVGSLLPVSFTDFADLNAQYLIISNARLFDDANGVNQVQEYASYRSSPAGGGFSTAVVDIQQLYDQFAWGLNRHPLSIRNFTNYVKKNWPDIQYLLIIGKGREYLGIRTAAQLADPSNESFFVPTYGSPGSDNLLTSQLNSSTPLLPMGRIAVSDPADIAVYLKKVKDFEANASSLANADRLWRKKVLHLGGGASSTEQSVIKNYLLNLETQIEKNQFGANVASFYKTSTDPIQVSISDQIFDVINQGVSIITFFGHSAVSTFDFNIDNPDNYDNFARYPLMISLGCYSGNIHTNGRGISERFVFQPDKGALGMIATAGQGYISSLYAVTDKYYHNLGDSLYGQSIGLILFKTLRHFDINNSIQPELLEQFYLHGDPAIQFGLAPGPDYLPDPGSVKVSPAHVNTSLDSFSLHFSVLNLGKNSADSISVNIEQTLPGGAQGTVLNYSARAPAFATDFEVKLPVGAKEAVGRNWLNITVDPENNIEEYPPSSAELNNALSSLNGQGGYPLFISDNGALPVYPADFAIVTSPDITLRATTANLLSAPANYVFEIDTTARFDSPSRQTAVLLQPGGLLEWKPAMNFPPGSTCYWRVSPDSLSEENGFAWENRSFTWLPGHKEGWGQFHYYQFQENRFDGLELNQQSRQLNFAKDYLNLRIRNKLYNFNDQPNGFVNGVRWSDFFRWELQGSLTVVVFDTLGNIWMNFKPGEHGSVNNTAARIGAFPFPADNLQQRAKIIDFIDNVIPDKYWVVVYPARRTANNNLSVSDWAADSLQLNGKNIFNTLEAQGAQQIRSLENLMVPYFLAFRKNNGLIQEEVGNATDATLESEINIPGVWHQGLMQSVAAGPASIWEDFAWNFDTTGMNDKDSFYVNVIGMSKDLLSEELLLAGIGLHEMDLSAVNPDSFPFLRLEFFAKDSLQRSPVQLLNWSLHYEGLPDIGFDPGSHFSFYADTLMSGDSLRLSCDVRLTNGLDLDSFQVKYQIIHQSGLAGELLQRFDSLAAGASRRLSFSYPTAGLAGNYQLQLQLLPNGQAQDLHDVNNYLVLDFFVERDRSQPLLDITFDGMRIMNGAIVSPKPEVVISIQDENAFMLLSDTSIVSIILLHPDGRRETISMGSADIQFLPAKDTKNNRAVIYWRPTFTRAGKYELLVQAADAAGNPTGPAPRKVSFQVILESSISNFLPYPNPFSSSTRFAYTMTGEEPPAALKLQIMTVAGRIVREFTQAEIGPLKTGTHLTDFAWDGTDEFGERLANGIYLYRLIARDDEQEALKHFETGADKYFNRNFGKIAIIR